MKEEEKWEIGKFGSIALCTFGISFFLCTLSTLHWSLPPQFRWLSALYYVGLTIGLGGWVVSYLCALYVGFRDRSSEETRTVGALLFIWFVVGMFLLCADPSGILFGHLITFTEQGWSSPLGRAFASWVGFMLVTSSICVVRENRQKV